MKKQGEIHQQRAYLYHKEGHPLNIELNNYTSYQQKNNQCKYLYQTTSNGNDFLSNMLQYYTVSNQNNAVPSNINLFPIFSSIFWWIKSLKQLFIRHFKTAFTAKSQFKLKKKNGRFPAPGPNTSKLPRWENLVFDTNFSTQKMDDHFWTIPMRYNRIYGDTLINSLTDE